jgi:ATP-dependent Clp protease protease subunit
MQDFARPRYFNPYEAVSYGLIDTVSCPESTRVHERALVVCQ